MAKIRIFQIAKELNISHTDILNYLKSKNVQISSHMSPVDDEVHKMIMDEFAKDKEQVDRFRKEKVRREIHDTKLKAQQQSTKKLKLLSLSDQRKLEKQEIERKAQEKEQEKDRIFKKEQQKNDEVEQRKQEYDNQKEIDKNKNEKQNLSSKKAKELNNKFKSQKKLRSIKLSDIRTEINVGSKKQKK